MKWLDNKYSRHAVIYGALSPPCPPTPRPPRFPAWHLSLRVDFLLMPGRADAAMDAGMLSRPTDASHDAPIKTISPGYKKCCKEAMSHGIQGAGAAPGSDTLLTPRHRGTQECCNDLSSLSDGLQSTQCMTISYNNPGPVMKILFTERPHIIQQGERIFQLGRTITWSRMLHWGNKWSLSCFNLCPILRWDLLRSVVSVIVLFPLSLTMDVFLGISTLVYNIHI